MSFNFLMLITCTTVAVAMLTTLSCFYLSTGVLDIKNIQNFLMS